MLDLSNYIKHEFIKSKYLKSCTTISDVEEVKNIANSVLLENKIRYNLIFECSYLKDYFLSLLKQGNSDICIINCEASSDRLSDDINNLLINSPKICIFDHVNNCNDMQIMESINKLPSILIC